MELRITTPSLLFPAISLIQLSYTQRYLALTELIRSLLEQHQTGKKGRLMEQVAGLNRQAQLIRNMQFCATLSNAVCLACMLLVYTGQQGPAKWLFVVSIVVLMISMGLSLIEQSMLGKSLKIHIEEIKSL